MDDQSVLYTILNSETVVKNRKTKGTRSYKEKEKTAV